MKNLIGSTVFLTIFAIILGSCHYVKPDKENGIFCGDISGMWSAVHANIGLSLTDDSLFWFAYKIKDEPIISDSYTCTTTGDSLLVCSGDSWLRLMIVKSNKKYVLWNYKGEPFKDHIDEVYEIRKANSNISTEHDVKPKMDIVVLPNGFRGLCLIAFNQDDGQLITYDDFGNRVFSFNDTSSFFIKSEALENPFNIATMNMKIYYSDSSGQLTEISLIDKFELKTNNFDTTGIYAISYGFNQVSRGIINRIVGEKVGGNIAFFRIGNVKNHSFSSDSIFYKGKYYSLSQF